MSYTSDHTPRCRCGEPYGPVEAAAGDMLKALKAIRRAYRNDIWLPGVPNRNQEAQRMAELAIEKAEGKS